MADLYLPSGDVQTVTPANGDAFTLAELQGFVAGYIEAIYFRDGRVMFVNEEGQREQLPINHRATIEAYANARVHPDTVILGAAIVVSWREAGGEAEADDAAG